MTNTKEQILVRALSKQNEMICQILGKVLGFPWYKDDQKNFPGTTEEDGICEGHYVAEDLAHMAADRIVSLEEQLKAKNVPSLASESILTLTEVVEP